MKYNKLSQCLIAALCSMTAFSSCSDDIMSSKTDEKTAETTFKAVIESPTSALGSRTYLGEENLEGTKIYWEEGDEIAVGKDKSCFTSTSGGSRETEFTGGALTFTPGEDLYAFYPNAYYHPDPDDEEFEPLPYGYIEIPKQQYWSWSYAKNAQMIAKLKDGVFKFKPTCALIKVQLDNTLYRKCKKIRVTSENNSAYLSGQYKASIDNNGDIDLTMRVVSNKAQIYKYVDLVDPMYEYNYLPVNYDLYIAVAPETVNKLVMEFHTDNGVITKTSTSKKTFECGEIWDAGTIDINGDNIEIHTCSHYYKDAGGVTPNNVKWVDLGTEDGVLWANMNLGAEDEYSYGDYYAWSATEPYCIAYDMDENGIVSADNSTTLLRNIHWLKDRKRNYDGTNWVQYGGYCRENVPYYSGNTETVDGFDKYDYATQNTLELADDAAHVQWDKNGTSIITPTFDHAYNLKNKCYWVVCDGKTRKYNGSSTPGCVIFKIKSNGSVVGGNFAWYDDPYDENYNLGTAEKPTTDIHIFIPAAGQINDGYTFSSTADEVVYNTSTVSNFFNKNWIWGGGATISWQHKIYPVKYDGTFNEREYGVPIRPVKKVN